MSKTKSYTIKDMYLWYKTQILSNTIYDVPFNIYSDICVEYFKYIRDSIIEDSKEIKLGYRLGELMINKKLETEKELKNLSVDFKLSKEYKKRIVHTNEHTNGYKFNFYWSKQHCIVENKGKYNFVATRANKRRLAYLLKEEHKDYSQKY